MIQTKPHWIVKNKDVLFQIKINRKKAIQSIQNKITEKRPMLKELIPYQTMTLQFNTSDENNPSPILWTPPKGYGFNVSEYNYATLSLIVNTYSTTTGYSYLQFTLEDSHDDFTYSLIESSYIQLAIGNATAILPESTPQEYTFKEMRKFVGFSNFIKPKITASGYLPSFSIRATLMLEKL